MGNDTKSQYGRLIGNSTKVTIALIILVVGVLALVLVSDIPALTGNFLFGDSSGTKLIDQGRAVLYENENSQGSYILSNPGENPIDVVVFAKETAASGLGEIYIPKTGWRNLSKTQGLCIAFNLSGKSQIEGFLFTINETYPKEPLRGVTMASNYSGKTSICKSGEYMPETNKSAD